tara:strand:+ start:3687 stop:4235 length:549 start_codon:yes stop_codon:yes gene_type:complete
MATDKSNRHKRFYPRKTDRVDLSKFHVKSGMIVEFPYRGDSKSSRPLVFVMDTDEYAQGKKKKFSGINLNYLPSFEIERFFTRILSETGWEIDRHTKAAKVDLWEEEDEGLKPIVLYNKIVKKSLLPKYQCWRSYSYHKIMEIYQVRFHFKTTPLNLIYEGNQRLGRVKKSEMHKILRTINK